MAVNVLRKVAGKYFHSAGVHDNHQFQMIYSFENTFTFQKRSRTGVPHI